MPAFAATPRFADVAAVFSKHCLSCHDAKNAEGKLVMESFDSLMKGGEDGPALVPGKADDSVLVRQIEHKAKPFMPPKKANDTLTAEEIALIRNWIAGGALPPAPGEKVPAVTPVVSVPHIEPKVAPRKPIRAVAWSASAKLLAVARDEQVRLVSLEDRAVVRKLHVEAGSVNALAFSADGMTLAAGAGEPGAGGEIDLWKVADGSRLQHLSGHADAVYSLAMSPDGKTLASGSYDDKIILWDVETGKAKQTLDGHNGAILGLDFRPDGNVLASASADRTVKLWDVKTGARLDTFAESLKELNGVRFTPDGARVIAGGADNRIRVWQLGPAAKEGTNKLLVAQFAHEGAILRLAVSADGKLLATSADDRTVKLWDPQPTTADGSPELKMLRVLPAQSDWPVTATFAGDDKVLVVGRLDGTLGFYDAGSAAEIPPPKPELTGVEPRGLQRGVAGRLVLQGKHLSDLSGVTLVDPAGKVVSRGMGVSPMRSDSPQGSIIAPDDCQHGQDARATGQPVEITPPADLPLGEYQLKVAGPGGESGPVKVFVDDLPQVWRPEPAENIAAPKAVSLPADVWGTFARRGEQDAFPFDGKAGETIVLDGASQRLGSPAKLVVDLLDSAGRLLATANGFDGDPEPLLAFRLPTDGRYVVRVGEAEASASDAHFYRVSVGDFAYVTGAFPLAVSAGSRATVSLLGLNVPADARAVVRTESPGETDVPLDPSRFRSRRPVRVMVSASPEPTEAEPNDTPDHAGSLSVPGSVNGRIDVPGDADLYRFEAKAGRNYVLETLASRRGSPADTVIEVLHADGSPVPRVKLRAVRDSAITFRGFDASAQGARLQNWEEMDLNQYLYLSGEVVRLMLAPRGPDSEYGFFTIAGKRRCYYDTTATAHALDEKCYIVEPHDPKDTFAPNGLPTFTINYVNDDDADRKLGSDSHLLFTAPAEGPYLARVTDARGAGGARYVYRLSIRPAEPDFNVSLDLSNPAVPAGAGKNFSLNLDRIDGFDGPVKVEITGAPPGFSISSPLVIDAGHNVARGTIYALPDAPAPTASNDSAAKLVATGTVNGKAVSKPVNGFGKITLAPRPALSVGLDPAGQPATRPAGAVPEITVTPAQFTPARLWIERHDFKDEVTFEVDNLPHGVIVADIGLNGVLIPENQSERQIFLHTAPWVPDQDRLCYARALQAGNPTSFPVLIHVRRAVEQSKK